MRFAHFADVHVGSWRDSVLSSISLECFEAAIDRCINYKVDFVLIAGDLFNTSLPSVDQLKAVTSKLHQMHTVGIPCYVIPGSHDFSPSGKSMIEVLEAAGLVVNVMKGEVHEGKIRLRFTVDVKTGAKITGIIGKKGMLDKHFYEALDREALEAECGFKIFLWHTAIEEFKPKGLEKMEGMPLSFLPKGFAYYAGGHVHVRMDELPTGYGRITLPGSLFPVNFDELEKYGHGGMYLYDDAQKEPLRWESLVLYPNIALEFDCQGKSAAQVREEVLRTTTFPKNALITLRFTGTLKGAKIGELDFKEIFDVFYERGAKVVQKNTLHLFTQEFEEVKVSFSSVDEVERSLLEEHTATFKEKASHMRDLALRLMRACDVSKLEGEKVADFEKRILQEAKTVTKEF